MKISRTLHSQTSRRSSLILSFFFDGIAFALEDYTPSVDSAMESWTSSNADNSDPMAKDILVNDHQHYQIPKSLNSR